MQTLKGVSQRTHLDKEWDSLVDAALGRLDQGDITGFWDGIEELNRFTTVNA